MDPETVQALRDTKGLYDEGILTEAEYKEKKAELLKPKPKAAPAPAAAPPRKKASEAGGAKKKKASEASDAAPAKKQKAADDGDAPAKKAKTGGKAAELVLQDSGAAGVLVTGGGTFRAKSLLSSLGGTWSKPLKAWVFAAGSAEKTVAALEASASPPVDLTVADAAEGATRDREAALQRARDDALAAAAGGEANATLTIEPHKKAIVVRGDTKAVTATLKALEGSWNRALGGWVFRRGQRDAVLAALRADATNTVSLDEGLAAAPAPPPPPPPPPGPRPSSTPEADVAAAVASIPRADDAADAKDAARTPAPTSSEFKTKASRELPAWSAGGSVAPGKDDD